MSGDGKGKTILVTGGGGYIGSHCVHELLVEEYDVVAIDNFANSVPGIQDSAKIHIGYPSISKGFSYSAPPNSYFNCYRGN